MYDSDVVCSVQCAATLHESLLVHRCHGCSVYMYRNTADVTCVVCSLVLVTVRTTLDESLVHAWVQWQRVHVQEHADVTSVVCSVVLVRSTLDESLVHGTVYGKYEVCS